MASGHQQPGNIPSQIENQIEQFLDHFRYAHSLYLENQQHCSEQLEILDISSDDMEDYRGRQSQFVESYRSNHLQFIKDDVERPHGNKSPSLKDDGESCHGNPEQLPGDDMNSYITSQGNRLSLVTQPSYLHLTSQVGSLGSPSNAQ